MLLFFYFILSADVENLDVSDILSPVSLGELSFSDLVNATDMSPPVTPIKVAPQPAISMFVGILKINILFMYTGCFRSLGKY